MLDIKFIRENKDLITFGAKKKHIDFDVEALLRIDDRRRQLTLSIDKKRAAQNEVSEKIVRTEDQIQKGTMIAEMKQLKEQLQKDEEEMKKVMHDWQMRMVAVPNLPVISVPDGVGDNDIKEVTGWGEKPSLEF